MQALNSYLSYLKHQRNYSTHTIENYKRDIQSFLNFIQSLYKIKRVSPALFESISIETVYKWFQHLNVSNRSLARKISALRSFAHYLKRQGIIERNPFIQLHLPKLPKRLISTLNEDQIQRLLTHLPPANNFSNARDRLLILLLYSCGLRRQELINLTIEQFNPHRQELRVQGKGNKTRIIPIPYALKQEIEHYLNIRKQKFGINSPSDHLLLNDNGKPLYPMFVQRKVKQYGGIISMKTHPHLLRHSIATHLRNRGVDIEFIRQFLGHASLSTTQIYLHTSKKQLKDTFKKYHPFE